MCRLHWHSRIVLLANFCALFARSYNHFKLKHLYILRLLSSVPFVNYKLISSRGCQREMTTNSIRHKGGGREENLGVVGRLQRTLIFMDSFVYILPVLVLFHGCHPDKPLKII